MQCASGQGARALAEGEFHSASAINKFVSEFVPVPRAWGQYDEEGETTYFFLGDFHDLNFTAPPDAENLMMKVIQLHQKGTSPNGMFGFPVPTVLGKMERTVAWEKSWAKAFSLQLEDVIHYDNEMNDPWPEYDAACKQLVDAVIPRLLGALQSEGREITPTLIHGDLWEKNVGIDTENDRIVAFDPGCTYSHNELEFGTWRCSWACHFRSPAYMRIYWNKIRPSKPAEEWDDRNRLYSMHAYLNDSAGHRDSNSRKM